MTKWEKYFLGKTKFFDGENIFWEKLYFLSFFCELDYSFSKSVRIFIFLPVRCAILTVLANILQIFLLEIGSKLQHSAGLVFYFLN
jgi:hypothetical protein